LWVIRDQVQAVLALLVFCAAIAWTMVVLI
jgi:hypothetical protein